MNWATVSWSRSASPGMLAVKLGIGLSIKILIINMIDFQF
jgi:hypothetical protein